MNLPRKKILVVFGTRPEAIKMAPVVKAFAADTSRFDTKVCVSAQHREMLDQVLEFFEIVPDYDLDVMTANQSLNELTGKLFTRLHPVLSEFNPDYVFVQGDTTTAMVGGIAGYYAGAKVCHIEAGLRTFDKQAPFPEEGNRCVISQVGDYHFAPTTVSAKNLWDEGVAKETVLVTGNTVIDALFESVERVKLLDAPEINHLRNVIQEGKKVVLVTSHRRENYGDGFRNIAAAVKEIAANPSVQVIFPVHLNPNVRKPIFDILGGIENVTLIDPLSYPSFVWLMERSTIILSDSGGVQEEAPSLGKPVLVMRDTTERPEAVEAGTVMLVGTDKQRIVECCNSLLTDDEKYKAMSALNNPYGDGTAAKQIVEFIGQLGQTEA